METTLRSRHGYSFLKRASMAYSAPCNSCCMPIQTVSSGPTRRLSNNQNNIGRPTMFINGLGRRYPSAANLCKTHTKEGKECAAVWIRQRAYQVATNAATTDWESLPCCVLGSFYMNYVCTRVGYVHYATQRGNRLGESALLCTW